MLAGLSVHTASIRKRLAKRFRVLWHPLAKKRLDFRNTDRHGRRLEAGIKSAERRILAEHTI